MPRLIVAGEKSKNPGRKFLQYDPAIKGDLPDAKAQSLYDKQAGTLAKHAVEEKEFTDYMVHLAKAGGATFEPVVLMNYKKVAIAIDDGKGRKAAPTVAGDAVNWAKVSAALIS
jgi:hypothetical protein